MKVKSKGHMGACFVPSGTCRSCVVRYSLMKFLLRYTRVLARLARTQGPCRCIRAQFFATASCVNGKHRQSPPQVMKAGAVCISRCNVRSNKLAHVLHFLAICAKLGPLDHRAPCSQCT